MCYRRRRSSASVVPLVPAEISIQGIRRAHGVGGVTSSAADPAHSSADDTHATGDLQSHGDVHDKGAQKQKHAGGVGLKSAKSKKTKSIIISKMTAKAKKKKSSFSGESSSSGDDFLAHEDPPVAEFQRTASSAKGKQQQNERSPEIRSKLAALGEVFLNLPPLEEETVVLDSNSKEGTPSQESKDDTDEELTSQSESKPPQPPPNERATSLSPGTITHLPQSSTLEPASSPALSDSHTTLNNSLSPTSPSLILHDALSAQPKPNPSVLTPAPISTAAPATEVDSSASSLLPVQTIQQQSASETVPPVSKITQPTSTTEALQPTVIPSNEPTHPESQATITEDSNPPTPTGIVGTGIQCSPSTNQLAVESNLLIALSGVLSRQSPQSEQVQAPSPKRARVSEPPHVGPQTTTILTQEQPTTTTVSPDSSWP
ncbi:hypothetical protein Pelo_10903 [Pelomyxa schiedti]|nr:hypothetical protein Pelo_10903 [Pelomyxa schiedti]